MVLPAALLLWKMTDIVTALVAPHVIPYLGFFSYGRDVLIYNIPDFVRALSNFDGIFYIRIALKGYSETEQAFFPLYPLLIRFVNPLVLNPILSGILISHLAFVGGFIFLKKLLEETVSKKTVVWVLLFLLAYPTSYYFGVMYTESLFFFLFVLSLYFSRKKQFFFSFVAAYLLGVTRVVGVFASIPLLAPLLTKRPKKGEILPWVRVNRKTILVGLAPIAGLATYCFFLFVTTGDPLFFFHAQEEFGANRSTSLILPPQVIYRYLRIFLTADKNFQYAVALLELSFYLFTLAVLTYDLKKQLMQKKRGFERIGLNLFSLFNIILPSLTGTLTSIPRYSLLSFSIFFVLGEIRNTVFKVVLLTLFIVLHIIMFAFFVQGYFVT